MPSVEVIIEVVVEKHVLRQETYVDSKTVDALSAVHTTALELWQFDVLAKHVEIVYKSTINAAYSALD